MGRKVTTVRELIANLQDVDPELVVYYEDNEYGYEPVGEIRVDVNSIGKKGPWPSYPPWDGKPFLLLERGEIS